MTARLNFHEMAKRDPAIAALMGAIPGYDFGYSQPSEPALPPYWGPPAPQYGAQFGDEYGWGDDEYGDEYGWGFGLGSAFDPSMNIGFGAGPARAPARPPGPRRPPMPRGMGPTARPPLDPTGTLVRTMLLDPNRNSTVKVERYSFAFSPTAALVLGTASSISTFTQQPSASIKGQRVLMNAPQEGFVFVSTLQIANVNVFVGGTEDAFNYNPRAVGVMLDLPRLDPQNRATSAGAYSGSLPPGFTAASAFTFIITLQGPAVLAGGYGQ
jgi:hypothetical protein